MYFTTHASKWNTRQRNTDKKQHYSIYVNDVLLWRKCTNLNKRSKCELINHILIVIYRGRKKWGSSYLSIIYVTSHKRSAQRTCASAKKRKKTDVLHTHAPVQVYVEVPTQVHTCRCLTRKFAKRVTATLTRVRSSPFTEPNIYGRWEQIYAAASCISLGWRQREWRDGIAVDQQDGGSEVRWSKAW